MKFPKLSIVLLALLLPLGVSADVKQDMSNPQLSLVQVMQNGLGAGLSVSAVVQQMIRADASQSNSVIATAMVVAPDSYEQIIEAAINAGVEPSNVVAVALIAADGKNADKIIAATIAAAPASAQQSIVDASVRAIPQTTQGLRAIAGSPLKATGVGSSGGGAPATAQNVIDALAASAAVQLALADVEQQLTDAGFTDGEAETRISEIVTDLNEAEADVEAATTALGLIQDQIVALELAQEAALDAAAAEQAAELAAQEAEAQLKITQLERRVARLNRERLDQEIDEAQKNATTAAASSVDTQEAVAKVTAVETVTTAAITKGTATINQADTVIKNATTDIENAVLIDQVEIDAAIVETDAAIAEADVAIAEAATQLQAATNKKAAAELSLAQQPVQTIDEAVAIVAIADAEADVAVEAQIVAEEAFELAGLEVARAEGGLAAVGGIAAAPELNPLQLTAAEWNSILAVAKANLLSSEATLANATATAEEKIVARQQARLAKSAVTQAVNIVIAETAAIEAANIADAEAKKLKTVSVKTGNILRQLQNGLTVAEITSIGAQLNQEIAALDTITTNAAALTNKKGELVNLTTELDTLQDTAEAAAVSFLDDASVNDDELAILEVATAASLTGSTELAEALGGTTQERDEVEVLVEGCNNQPDPPLFIPLVSCRTSAGVELSQISGTFVAVTSTVGQAQCVTSYEVNFATSCPDTSGPVAI